MKKVFYLLLWWFLCASSISMGATYYVDVDNSSGVEDGLSWETATTAIQDAVDLTSNGDTVFVAEGVYDEGGRVGDYGTIINRVCITNEISVRGVGNRETTLIVGEGSGKLGANAIRCVSITGNAVFEGFTITNGYTHYRDAGYDRHGGGIRVLNENAIVSNCVFVGNRSACGAVYLRDGLVSDCIINNNVSDIGGGGHVSVGSGRIIRCIVRDNEATDYGGGVYIAGDGSCEDCLIDGNRAVLEGGGCVLSKNGCIINCTIANNNADNHNVDGVLVSSSNSYLYNSIIWSNGVTNVYGGSQCYNTCAPYGNGIENNINGCITNNPLFVDIVHSNYQLSVQSPCINAGSNGYVRTEYDLDGNERIIDGVVDMGAYENSGVVYYKFSVSSEVDAVYPAVGEHYYQDGRIIDCYSYMQATNDLLKCDCRGWALSGNDPASGTNNMVSICLTNNAELQWLWEVTDVYFSAQVVTGGQIIGANAWYPVNSSNTVVALPDKGKMFSRWEGDVPENSVSNNPLTLVADSPRTISACFTSQPSYYTHYVSTNSTIPMPPYGTWETASHTIQDAVDYCYDYDTVLVAEGIYDKGGHVGDYGTITNRVCITNQITVRGVGRREKTLIVGAADPETEDGLGANAVRCVSISDCRLNNLSGFTMTNGYTHVITSGYNGNGGGLRLINTACYVTNCTVAGNSSINGAVYINNGSYCNDCWIKDCLITDNQATDAGGGIFLDRGYIYNATLMNNEALNGGGIYFGAGGKVSGCLISENHTASDGGGVYLNSGTLISSTVQNNEANATGGGVYLGGTGKAEDCIIAGNSAVTEGGGCMSVSSGPIVSCVLSNNRASFGGGYYDGYVTNSVITDNVADNGGGGYGGTAICNIYLNNVASSNGGGAYGGMVYNSLFYSNSAKNAGGVFIDENTEVANSTIVMNDANVGGGVLLNGGSLLNCIVWTNQASAGKNIYNYSGIAEYTCSGDGVTHGEDGCLTNDPLLIYEQKEFSPFLSLEQNSPCVNAGNNAYAPTNITPYDMAGSIRIIHDAVDMGAYELNRVFVTMNGDDGNSGYSWDDAKLTIQSAINIASNNGVVLVSNGVYSTGGKVAVEDGLFNRICVSNDICIKSINGPDYTSIVGAPGSNGSNDIDAVRCVWIANGASLCGFTISNGYTMAWGDVDGGGLWAKNAVVSNCVIAGNNAASSGGGAYFGGSVEMYNCLITNNYADAGGGVRVGAYCNISQCDFVNNTAESAGGGIDANNNTTIEYCRIWDNDAYQGGGASFSKSGSMSVGCSVENSLIFNNNAEDIGGGIYANAADFYNCTIAENTANNGGGCYNVKYTDSYGMYGDYSEYYNCIIWGNQATLTESNNYAGGHFYYSCTYPAPTNGNGNISNNPMFVNEDENNFKLNDGSPCCNTGSNEYVRTEYDLDGNERIIDGVVDMGAYEYAGILLSIASEHGEATPEVGYHSGQNGDVITNSINAVITLGETQYVCAGWIMVGNNPESGATNSFVMTHTNSANLTWIWTTNYWLDTSEPYTNGTLDVFTGWKPSQSNLLITASPDEYYVFDRWCGIDSTNAQVSLNMYRPYTICPCFVAKETTNTHTPEWWLASYGLTNFEEDAFLDSDGDGVPSWEEYLCGTIPNDPCSYLHLTGVNFNDGSFKLSWMGGTGVIQYLEMNTNVGYGAWVRILTNNPPMNTTNQVNIPKGDNGECYYRITVGQ